MLIPRVIAACLPPCLPARPPTCLPACLLVCLPTCLVSLFLPACLQESEEQPAAIERQTIIDMRGPQVCVYVCLSINVLPCCQHCTNQ